MKAGPPSDWIQPPSIVLDLAGGELVRAVWRNELGGLTFQLGAKRYVKWSPPGAPDLEAERVRLEWAAPYTPVPQVLGHGPDWLLTAALPGRSTVSTPASPAGMARAIGRALRALHDALPVESCPFSWSATERAARAGVPLAPSPSIDRLVVCHGDACAPNTIVDETGEWVGHVDFGRLGVADRWADLAVATWSLEWNFGFGWDGELLAAYGVDPDPLRTDYYRRLWAAT